MADIKISPFFCVSATLIYYLNMKKRYSEILLSFSQDCGFACFFGHLSIPVVPLEWMGATERDAAKRARKYFSLNPDHAQEHKYTSFCLLLFRAFCQADFPSIINILHFSNTFHLRSSMCFISVIKCSLCKVKYHLYYTDEEMEAQKGDVNCPRSHTESVTRLGIPTLCLYHPSSQLGSFSGSWTSSPLTIFYCISVGTQWEK